MGATPVEDLAIDHVVLAARSRDAARAVLADAGLGVATSRAIAGTGLSNLVVPFGPSSLEIHYPNGNPVADQAPPYARAQQKALAAHADSQLVPVAWIVRYEEERRLREVSEANDYPAQHSADTEPELPRYVLGGLGAAFERPWLPSLIYWDLEPKQRPHARPAAHQRRPTGELDLEVSGPYEEIIEWCQGEPRGLLARPGRQGPLRVHIHTAEGTPIVLGIA